MSCCKPGPMLLFRGPEIGPLIELLPTMGPLTDPEIGPTVEEPFPPPVAACPLPAPLVGRELEVLGLMDSIPNCSGTVYL